MRNTFLVTYDICEDRRLAKVHKIMRGFGDSTTCCCAVSTWTPYIATRYAKTRGRHRRDLRLPQHRTGFLLDDLREQVRQVLGIDPNAAHIKAMADAHGAFRVRERWRPIQFKRYRSKRSDDGGQRLAGAFHIRFDTLVAGPIALGHSSHFGLGLFVPVSGD